MANETTERYPDLQYLSQDDTKRVDYLRVCVLIHQVLRSSMTAKELFDIMETMDEWQEDTTTTEVAFVDTDKRPSFAKEFVDKYLLRHEPP